METSHEALDKKPWHITVGNGTLDFRTGELRPHDPNDFITKMTPVKYYRDARAPKFHEFLRRIMPDAEIRSFLQRFFGYALTGDVSAQILPFFYGTGKNGKSTLVNTILKIAGDYGQQAAPDLLMVKKNSHPTELADLFGALRAVRGGRRGQAPRGEPRQAAHRWRAHQDPAHAGGLLGV